MNARNIVIWLLAMGATTAAAAPAGVDGLGALDQFTAEQLDQLLQDAGPIRLARERQTVAEEIAAGQLHDGASLQQAEAILTGDAADTPVDNVRLITSAYAAVDSRLGGPIALAAAGRHAEAALAAKALIDPEGRTYLDAVRRMMHADALSAAGDHEAAADAYVALVRQMGAKVSFASTAALKGAASYEAIGRTMYASRLHGWWVDNYSFLDPAAAEQLAAKIKTVQQEYAQPLVTLADRMNSVATRLGGQDSGRQTQDAAGKIVAMLDDLIAMAEANAGEGGSPGQSSGTCSNCGRGDCSGNCGRDGPTDSPGPAKPSRPAEQSTLPAGEAVQPAGASVLRPDDDSDAWGQLPIRQREQLSEAFRQRYPQRYDEMLKAYNQRLAEPE